MIIGLTGKNAAGKGEVANYLKSKEFIYSGSLNPLGSISLFIAPHLVKTSIFGAAGDWESCIYIGFLPIFFSFLAVYVGRKDPLIKFFIILYPRPLIIILFRITLRIFRIIN